MDEKFLKEVGAQLRKPAGDLGVEVAEKMNESNREMNLKSIGWLSILENQRILEIGMGNGHFIKQIIQQADNVRYYGCDHSEDMVRLTEKNNRDLIANGKVSLHHSQAHSLPVEDCCLNSVLTVNTIYFWDDPRSVLKEIRRVLVNDGKLVIAFRPAQCLSIYPTTRYDFRYYEPAEIEDLLISTGFTVTRSGSYTERRKVEILGKKYEAQFTLVEGVLMK